MDERKLGFFNPSTNTFIVIEEEEEFKKILQKLQIKQKQTFSNEFERRLAREKFDDFDYIVEEVAKTSSQAVSEELIQY